MLTRWWLLVAVATAGGGSLCSGQDCTGTGNDSITPMSGPGNQVQTDVYTVTWADTTNTTGQIEAAGCCAEIQACTNGAEQTTSYRAFAPLGRFGLI